MSYSTYDITEFTRLYLVCFYSLVALFYTLRICALATTESPKRIYAGASFSSTWWNHMAFRAFRTTIWTVCVIRWIYPNTDAYLGLFDAPCFYSMLLGNVLLAMGFANAILLNVYMGNQWRSGIDPNGPTLLITQGLFKYSRNPMFLGVGIAQLGFFLALPSWFSLICLMVGWAAIYRQTISEEKHLQARFPDEYAIYTTKVRRWL